MSDGPPLDPRIGCLVVAAGSGARLGADRPKAFVELAGRSLLSHAVARVRAAGVGEVVAVVPAALTVQAAAMVPQHVQVVAGGTDRQASVAAGLAALPASVRVVLVHDAARCLAPPELIRAVAEAVTAGRPAVVPGLPVADTVKLVDAAGRVTGTVERAAVRLAQTPQGFDRELLERAHAAAGADRRTDDGGLVELLGEPVHIVPGHPRALKVTTAEDLALAGRLLGC